MSFVPNFFFLIYVLGNLEHFLTESYNVGSRLRLIVILLLFYSNNFFLLTRNSLHLNKKLKVCK